MIATPEKECSSVCRTLAPGVAPSRRPDAICCRPWCASSSRSYTVNAYALLAPASCAWVCSVSTARTWVNDRTDSASTGTRADSTNRAKIRRATRPQMNVPSTFILKAQKSLASPTKSPLRPRTTSSWLGWAVSGGTLWPSLPGLYRS